MLATVLASPSAVKELESGASLDMAYSYTDGVNNDLMEHLQNAKKHLRAANGLAPSSTPTAAHTRAAEELIELADSLEATIARKTQRMSRGR